MRAPRVLVVTVNALSTTSNNGKTFSSFFEGYPKDSLAQLFFHREVPTSPVCDNYYRIGDEEFVRHLVRRRPVLGEVAERGDAVDFLVPQDAINVAKSSETIRMARSLVWTRLDFTAPGVTEWLDDFAPEVIFFCGGDANYLYRPVLDLVERFDAKLVYYITDDYVLDREDASFIERRKRAWTRRLFIETARRSDLVLTIGDEMSRVYRETFGVESEQMMNLVHLPERLQARAEVTHTPARLAFVGGLHLERWRSLLWIADGLERVSPECDAILDVYSQSVPEEVAKAFQAHPRLRYAGSLDADAVPGVLENEADVLVHVESYLPEARHATALSVSTKIPEYLAAGKPVLAVGPGEVASLRYLSEGGAAFVVPTESDDVLDQQLRSALTSAPERERVVDRGFDLLRANHDGGARRTWFHRRLLEMRSR
ncbi:glycosyltransferase family protein [Mariniluteicoccus flavus]